MQARASADRRAAKHQAREEAVPPRGPPRRDQSASSGLKAGGNLKLSGRGSSKGASSRGNSQNIALNSGRRASATSGLKLDRSGDLALKIPGADQLWQSRPLGALAAQKQAAQRAQQLLAPRRPKKQKETGKFKAAAAEA